MIESEVVAALRYLAGHRSTPHCRYFQRWIALLIFPAFDD
jgi:hypothetical protein